VDVQDGGDEKADRRGGEEHVKHGEARMRDVDVGSDEAFLRIL
jgi:hypothetical protein